VSTLRDAGGIVMDRLYQLRQQARNVTRREEPSERYPGGDRAPVLLLPGVYETWAYLRPVADRLHELGHPIHTLPDLGHNRGPIAASARRGQAYLERRDLDGVILVGHSKGGIIGKHMMVTDDTSGRIDQLIAVNSPFDGSSLARFAPNAALRAFHPRNELLLALAAELEANGRITSVYSRLDPIIPGGSRLEGARNVELSMVGHFRPLGSPQLLTIVEQAVAAQRRRPEGAAEVAE
jgi:triacylglycerol lipase